MWKWKSSRRAAKTMDSSIDLGWQAGAAIFRALQDRLEDPFNLLTVRCGYIQFERQRLRKPIMFRPIPDKPARGQAQLANYRRYGYVQSRGHFFQGHAPEKAKLDRQRMSEHQIIRMNGSPEGLAPNGKVIRMGVRMRDPMREVMTRRQFTIGAATGAAAIAAPPS